jgi:hypothetical protein
MSLFGDVATALTVYAIIKNAQIRNEWDLFTGEDLKSYLSRLFPETLAWMAEMNYIVPRGKGYLVTSKFVAECYHEAPALLPKAA